MKLKEVSRRSFLQGLAVLGATGVIAGCSKDDDTYLGSGGGPLEGAIDEEDLKDRSQFELYGVTCPHNCGPSTQCYNKAWVKNGKIVRMTSEDTWLGPDGTPYNRDINDARKLACPRGRAIKGRVHHTGRLKYPMKQTKARGDLTGFVRISWEQAYDEVLRKYWAILAKYGTSAIQAGGPYNSGSTTGVVTTSGASRGSYANHSFHQFMHAYPLVGVPGNTGWSAACNIGTQANYCYHGLIKNWVSFGANGMSTNSTLSHVYLMANKKAVELDPSFKHYIITPELTDTGVLCATDWVQIRNQTDPALIAGMIYHMIDKSFTADGKIIPISEGGLLDIDYIDTALYGFFDSPEYMIKNATSTAGYFEGTDTNRGSNITAANNPYYSLPNGSIIVGDWERERINIWIHNTTGAVVKTRPADADTNYTWQPYRWKSLKVAGRYAYTAPARTISAVEPGKSYAAWLMGNDQRLTKAMYDDNRNTKGRNYTAKRYVSDGVAKARAALCSYPVKGTPAKDVTNWNTATGYYTKKDYMTPKSPEWAEKICGTPAATIRELAELYAKESNHPIITEWTGGLQKSENGCITLMAIQTLFAVTKCWGWSAGSVGTPHASYGSSLPGNMGSSVGLPSGYTAFSAVTPGSGGGGRSGSANPTNPTMSCAEHHNGPYFAFREKLAERAQDKFIGYGNPEWNGEDRYLYDAPAAKAQVLYKRSGDAAGFLEYDKVDPDGVTRTYVDFIGRDESAAEAHKPVFAGKRMYIGGNGVMMNGIQAPNWQAEIMSKLPLAGDNPDDPDTFCLAAFDFHLHVHVRYADYVFPCASTYEESISGSPGGRSFSSAPLVTPPGEALTQWDAAYRGWRQRYKTLGNGSKTFERIDGANDFTLTTPADAHLRVIGETTSEAYKPQMQKYMEQAQKTLNALTPSSPFYGYSIKDYIALQVRGINQQTVATAPAAPTKNNATRTNLDNYLAGGWATADLANDPFITFGSNRSMSPAAAQCLAGHTSATQAELAQYASGSGLTGAGTGTASASALMGRMCCYIEYAVKLWEKSMDRFHGWLPFEKRGNKADDYEGDPKILPIPLYYDIRDSFNEMYGVFNPNPERKNLQAGWKLIGAKPATNDISLIKDRLTITFGNTHDRFRSHSSTAENGYTRELNHRIKGGGWASGNDWNHYGVIPDTDQNKEGENAGLATQRAGAVAKKDMKIASWHEFWLNDEDCAEFGIKDGDLIRVSNPVGAVRAIARVTGRIVRGHGQLHHGAWYDPSPVDGVDDGACPGTLTCGRPSKLDNGNSLHCGYCVVEKETSFR